MQFTEAQTVNLSRRREQPPKFMARAFKGLRGLFASILGLCVRVEDDMVTHYAGCAWTDAVERQMINDIASMRSAPHS